MRREDLVQKFDDLIHNFYGKSISHDNIQLLFREFIGRVVNTKANSFFKCQDVLQRLRENKGVDAQVALRDRLKVYAGEKHAKLFE